MAEKGDYWAVLVVPWRPRYIYIFGSCLLVLTFVPMAVAWGIDRFQSVRAPELPDWWLFVPMALTLFIMLILYVVNILVERAAARLPDGAVLRSHCIVVSSLIQCPGVAQIANETLLIRPLVGKQISIPLGEISAVSERRWYNGALYPGKTAFFKLTVPESLSRKWRLGFGVADAEQWRKLLPNCGKKG